MSDPTALMLADPLFITLVAAIFGLVMGSFLNVVIYRLPIIMERNWRRDCAELAGEAPAPQERFDLVMPRSRCPHCGQMVTARDNIPVLSYLLLRGRCRACGARLSLRYPLVELLTAALTVVTALHFGLNMQGLFAVLLTWSLIALGFIDFDKQLLPDSITLPMLWLGLLLSLFGIYTDSQASIIGAAAGYLSLWSIYHLFRLLTGKEGMGYGDFKLFALFGAWLGWQSLPLIILLSSAVGAVLGLTLIVFRGRNRHIPLPFGPFLAIAGWIALLWGEQLNAWYLKTALPA
ncbi:prepilin peptidase [Sulfurivermis fontis]|uniref:prepilin peptidase n=1 Tax=Sulfurivermis fontis TaxID=1972068 RepID=UPI0018D54A7B|nr:A24 family peptidase [Sulfurivermis fontis]